MSSLIHNRFLRLKALQSPSTHTLSGVASKPALRARRYESFAPLPKVPDGPGRLAQILGASTRTNQYGEYLALHCWFADPPQFTPDITALRLLVPDIPEDVADPGQWPFVDTETTGLAGGSGTYAFLVGLGRWEGGGLEVEQFFMREYNEERSLQRDDLGRVRGEGLSGRGTGKPMQGRSATMQSVEKSG